MNSESRALDLKHLWHPFHHVRSFAEHQLVVVGGEGPYLAADDGKRYLDAISGLWNVNLGYSEHRIAESIYKQLQIMPFTSLIVFSHEPAIRLARVLAQKAPGTLETVFFTSGGSEGVETSIKLARHAMRVRGEPLRQKIIAFRRSYHGMSYGALSATGITEDRWQFGALLHEIVHVTSPHDLLPSKLSSEEVTKSILHEVESTLKFHDPKTVAGVIVEPVMGVAGMVPLPLNLLKGLRMICDAHGIYLIFDEVATGFGRTGKLFAAEFFDVTPDMLILAKGMTAGYFPLGAVLISRAIFDVCQKSADTAFMHGFTYGGSPAGCAAALTCLQILEDENLLSKVSSDGDFLLSSLNNQLRPLPCVSDIRGLGLMLAIDFAPLTVNGKQAPLGRLVMKNAREHGVIVRTTYGGSTINLAPPFILSRDELACITETLKWATEKAFRETEQ